MSENLENFDEIKHLSETFKKRSLTKEEHNKMIAFAIENPKIPAIQIYFDVIKTDPTGICWRYQLRKSMELITGKKKIM